MPENISLPAVGGELRRRIERILNPSNHRSNGAWIALTVGTLILGCALVISAAETPADKAKAEAEQRRRIEYSKAKFGNLEDERSKIYIKYGPPDEMEVHPGKDEKWMYYSQSRKIYTFNLAAAATNEQMPKQGHESSIWRDLHIYFRQLFHGEPAKK